MTLDAGTRLGRYEIRSLLGAGGMGEVYLAFDAELRREVALKFLPAEVAADPKRLERFEREAQAASALNHPNILTVHDIGQTADGRRFFATELVRGRTLREHIGARRLKLGEVLDIAIQIAGALVEAHSHAPSIVHRDIKPENVMVRDDGYVKVLDFGLAKLTGRPGSSVDPEAATQTLVQTDPGAVMGTVAYMSPEQASGKEVDHRTDIWSLGVVLYEMLTGRLPFAGKSTSHTIVSILDDEPPPLAAHVPDAPETLQEVVSDALTKDRDARFQTAKQFHAKLVRLKRRLDAGGGLDHSVVPHASTASGEVAGRATGAQPSGSTAGVARATAVAAANTAAGAAAQTVSSTEFVAAKIRTHRKGAAVAVVVAAVVLAAAIVFKLVGAGFLAGRLFGGRGTEQRQPSPIASLQQMKFTRITVSGDVGWSFISPDGEFIARLVREKNKESLRLRAVTGTTEREIVPPADIYFHGGVTFSRDGNSVYYVAGETGRRFRRLYRVSVLGGDPQKLVDDVDSGVTLSPDGRRLAFTRYVPKASEDMLVVANEDGTGEQVVATRRPPAALGEPAWSPDGQLLAYPVFSKDDEGEYAVIEATAPADRSTKLVSPAHWRYVNAIEWLPGGEGLVVSGKTRSAPAEDRGQIWYVPSDGGEPQKITNDANNYYGLSLTADARTALVMQSDLASNVWVGTAGDLARARQVTNSNSEIGELCWTPDGRIVYSSASGGRYQDLWVMNSDGTGNRQLTFTADRHDHQPSLSPDGRHVVYVVVHQAGLRSIWRMSMDGGGARELVRNVDQFADPQVSPDSRWVYYNSRDEAGHPCFWKVPFDGGQPVMVRAKTPCRLAPDGGRLACSYRDLAVADAITKLQIVPASGGDPTRTLDWPKDANALYWSPDGQSLDFIAERDGVPNVWRLSLASGREQRLTDWQTNVPLWWFAWSRDGKQLAVTRDTQTTHLVLIQNFR